MGFCNTGWWVIFVDAVVLIWNDAQAKPSIQLCRCSWQRLLSLYSIISYLAYWRYTKSQYNKVFLFLRSESLGVNLG